MSVEEILILWITLYTKKMNNNRPLSPHLTIHKWILSQIMSILHRATAIGFSFGSLFISL